MGMISFSFIMACADVAILSDVQLRSSFAACGLRLRAFARMFDSLRIIRISASATAD
jgi:hypothetical protein